MKNSFIDIAKQYEEEFVALRHHFHQNPELSFKEYKTSEKVASLLKEWGYEVKTGYGGTGVVGQLRKGSGSKKLGIRADMDALPILEQNHDLDYKSRNEGVMHACGHDGHTTMLLAAAKMLAKDINFSGTLNLIFQPAEEINIADSGAAMMVKDGLFRDFPCDAVFGAHNGPGGPQGHFAFRAGTVMASSDRATITFTGKGGHAAVPHLACDPIVAASSFVMALQTVVSRNIDPVRTGVVTVGAFRSGEFRNIIPNEAKLELSIRSLDQESRELMRERIQTLAKHQAKSFGAEAEIDYEFGYPILSNAEGATEFARHTAIELVGEDKVHHDPFPRTGSEDFAFMLKEVPGCYLFIGNGLSDGGSCGQSLHNPRYNFNDANIAVGAAYWALLASRYLK